MKLWTIYLIDLIIVMLLVFSVQYLFVGDQLYYQTFGDQLTVSRIGQILDYSKKWQWIGYAIIPLVILLRVFYTSIFLFVGVFFSELKTEFEKLFKIVLFADFIFVVEGLVKLIILIFFKQVNTLNDLQFTPFSVLEFFNSKSVDPLFIYPLSLLNIFEVGYFLVLTWLLVGIINAANEERPVKFGQSLKLVATSYGSGLLLWVLVVMFITLNLS